VSKALDMAIESEAQVVNMSFGTATPDRLMMQLIEAGAEKSIVFVAPVGNRPTAAAVPFPASHSKVLAVGGIDDKGAPFPNRTLALAADVCAPASHILCTIPGGGHNFLSGTSLSAAIVSGIVSVAKEKNRHLGIALLPAYDGDLRRWQEKLMHLSMRGVHP
jgi:subtilisin family serine protease